MSVFAIPTQLIAEIMFILDWITQSWLDKMREAILTHRQIHNALYVIPYTVG